MSETGKKHIDLSSEGHAKLIRIQGMLMQLDGKPISFDQIIQKSLGIYAKEIERALAKKSGAPAN